MLGQFVLWINAIAFIFYGLQCYFMPNLPADLIGFTLTNADAKIEIMAMYGGLQTAVGLLWI